MLITNQRLDKLSASRVDFISRALLFGVPAFEPNVGSLFGDLDAVPVLGPRVLNVVTLAITRGGYNSFYGLLPRV